MKNRESNFELLRIIAMLMIILHHIMVHGVLEGGIRTNLTSTDILSFSLASGGKIGVMIFMLITGYFLANKRVVNKKSMEALWIQVFTYSFGIYVAFSLLRAHYTFNLFDFSASLMPVVFSKYWFFTDYLVIVFLAPFINSGMQALKKQGLTVGLIILSIVWFVIPLVTTFIFNRSVVVVSNDFVLLTFTYVLGAYFRLHETLVMKSWKMRENRPGQYALSDFLRGNPAGTLTVVVARNLLIQVGGFPNVHHEDYALWLTLVKRNIQGYLMKDRLAAYRLGNDSVSSNKIKAALWTFQVLRDFGGVQGIKLIESYFRYMVNVLRR